MYLTFKMVEQLRTKSFIINEKIKETVIGVEVYEKNCKYSKPLI